MNFDWLCQTPSSDWTPFGTLLRQTLPLAEFKKKSEIVDDPDDTWKTKFDRWGNAQPTKFRHFSPPPVNNKPAILIVQNAPGRGR